MGRAVNPDVAVGTEHKSNKCGTFKILEYVNCNNIKIQFTKTNYITTTRASNIRTGKVKDLTYPAVHGVGFIGKGPYSSKDTKAYTVWNGMLRRCYSDTSLISKPSYTDCTVTIEWHCFQNFAEWYYDNYIEGYELDKDIIGTGKEYSPTNCIFASKEDNVRQASGTLNTTWVLTHTGSGKVVTVTNQAAFCREFNLPTSSIGALCTGKVTESNGYVLSG